MNAWLQMFVEPILSVLTPLDHTDVYVPLDLFRTADQRTH